MGSRTITADEARVATLQAIQNPRKHTAQEVAVMCGGWLQALEMAVQTGSHQHDIRTPILLTDKESIQLVVSTFRKLGYTVYLQNFCPAMCGSSNARAKFNITWDPEVG